MPDILDIDPVVRRLVLQNVTINKRRERNPIPVDISPRLRRREFRSLVVYASRNSCLAETSERFIDREHRIKMFAYFMPHNNARLYFKDAALAVDILSRKPYTTEVTQVTCSVIRKSF